ncbi:DUF58 domain-containing protein [Leifsonia sp. F6_8S_P_1B]|uniref:DUF58 domain-containing protein n=1 Tax=Leifsonia williamsii TaxID=3035919 RepID=A0ABT8KCJ3_9MICO|nr:DUF58 domain-containing protein [Leifsonia williamsii]MDN4615183.1 DUF58 domain-containing protein [Leifsonia williamsii]
MTTVTRTQAELTNARARIVGEREGVLADAIVWTVRTSAVVGHAVARVARRVSGVVTPLGWAMALLTVLALVAGYVFGWVEAVVLGWAALALLIIASGYLAGRLAYNVRLSLPANRVVVGDRAPGGVAVRNPLRRRLPGVRVEVPVGHGLAEFAAPSLGAGEEHADVFVVPTQRRGIVPIGPVRTVRADPIGLLRREVVWAESLDLFVHPRIIAIPSMSTGFVRDLEGAPTRDLTSSDIAFHALREYQPGDERRYIHWKSTAKTGSYMVRQFEETRRSHLLVALSLSEADYATDEEFEIAVSVAGSLGVRAMLDARTVSVVASAETPEFAKRMVFSSRRLRTVNRGSLLDDLSGVERATAALRLPELAQVAAEDAAGISIAFLVCGSTSTPAQLRAAASHFPLGVDVVAIVCDENAVPSLRRVADLSVLTIGYLEDLQRSLAKRLAT